MDFVEDDWSYSTPVLDADYKYRVVVFKPDSTNRFNNLYERVKMKIRQALRDDDKIPESVWRGYLKINMSSGWESYGKLLPSYLSESTSLYFRKPNTPEERVKYLEEHA